jgi:hypothetical protein
MRLASFTDSALSHQPRFGIVRGDSIVDVVAAANALHRAVPATSDKIALTTGAQALADDFWRFGARHHCCHRLHLQRGSAQLDLLQKGPLHCQLVQLLEPL